MSKKTDKEIVKSGTAIFSIGKGMGSLLTQVSREKLIEDKEVEKSITLLTDSCPGMERKMAFEIILGYKTLTTIVETQELYVDPDEFNEIEQHYVFYNYKRIEHKLRRLDMDAKSLKYYLQNDIIKAKKKSIFLGADVLIPYFNTGETDAIEDEVNFVHEEIKERYNASVSILKRFSIFFNWIIDSKKASIKYNVPITEELSNIPSDTHIPDNITSLHNYIQELEMGHIDNIIAKNNEEKEEFDAYVQGFKNLEKLDKAVKSKKGLEPVDPKGKKWDAGYISQEGDYYAVDGEIANMLHLNLADAMVKAGIIPKDFDGEINADVWLERKGWVKQHGDHILYGGYDNSKLNGKDVPISKAQLNTIKIIIRHWYNGIVWPGLDPANKCSVLRWVQSDPLQFRLKWFAW